MNFYFYLKSFCFSTSEQQKAESVWTAGTVTAPTLPTIPFHHQRNDWTGFLADSAASSISSTQFLAHSNSSCRNDCLLKSTNSKSTALKTTKTGTTIVGILFKVVSCLVFLAFFHQQPSTRMVLCWVRIPGQLKVPLSRIKTVKKSTIWPRICIAVELARLLIRKWPR